MPDGYRFSEVVESIEKQSERMEWLLCSTLLMYILCRAALTTLVSWKTLFLGKVFDCESPARPLLAQ